MLFARGEQETEDQHVQSIGADDEDGGEQEKSAWEIHVGKMAGFGCQTGVSLQNVVEMLAERGR